jgi:hypothetical protein
MFAVLLSATLSISSCTASASAAHTVPPLLLLASRSASGRSLPLPPSLPLPLSLPLLPPTCCCPCRWLWRVYGLMSGSSRPASHSLLTTMSF